MMETTYLTTRRFVKTQGNVIDFQDYKRKMERGDLPAYDVPEETPELSQEQPRQERRPLLQRAGDALDLAASLALTVSALAAVLLLF
ncbi:MAG: hypothetical protein LUG44_05815 [Clostridiales bacterium]|nr:hypothetical protein [Clostridiales bacterium]MCD7887118.1 hypothetical protein [Clostridiales bacterium]